MRARTRTAVHPALSIMRHEASRHLVRFRTDLEVHDARALSRHAHTDAFGWVLHSAATWLAFMGTEHRDHRFACVFVQAYGAADCRFYFWNGAVMTEYRCAADLDEKIADFEDELRRRAREGELADRGIA